MQFKGKMQMYLRAPAQSKFADNSNGTSSRVRRTLIERLNDIRLAGRGSCEHASLSERHTQHHIAVCVTQQFVSM